MTEVIGFILAALVGVSLGLIGGGGSILTVPILVYVIGLNPVLATSYSLFIVESSSLVGAVNNYQKGFVRFKTALLFGSSSIATVFVTRKIIVPAIPSVLFSTTHFRITQSMATMVLFAIMMLLAAVTMLQSKILTSSQNKNTAKIEAPIIKLILYGILIGLTTGLLGAGGGFLVIPALVIMLKMPMKDAIGTSLLIIGLNSLIGFTGDIGHFVINWKFLISITLVAIAGIFAGSFLGTKIEGDKLRKSFGGFVLVMGIYVFVKELFFHQKEYIFEEFSYMEVLGIKEFEIVFQIIYPLYIILKILL